MDIYQGIAYHYARDGQQFGPYEGNQLIEMALSGAMLPTDHVWTEGMTDWMPTPAFSQLGAALAARSTAGPAPTIVATERIPMGKLRQEQLRQEKARQEQQRQEQLQNEKLQKEKLRQDEIRRQAQRQEKIRRQRLRLAALRKKFPGASQFLLPLLLGAAFILAGLAAYFGEMDTRAQSYSFQTVEDFVAFKAEAEADALGHQFRQRISLALLILAALAYLAVSLLYLYRGWHYVQDVPDVATTPGRAVFFLLIPLFNLFWIETAFRRWHRDYLKKPGALPLRSWLFRLPRWIFVAALPLLHPFVMREVVKAVNYLSLEKIENELVSGEDELVSGEK